MVQLANCKKLERLALQASVFLPAGVNGLALGAPLELSHGDGANVLQVVGGGAGDDVVPDNGGVGGVLGGRPLGGDIDEDVLGVPGEERREIGLERELDNGVLLLLGAVVVGAALDSVWETRG